MPAGTASWVTWNASVSSRDAVGQVFSRFAMHTSVVQRTQTFVEYFIR